MINPSAIIGEYVSIGENVVIEENVKIGDHVTIGHHVIIKKDTNIGNYAQIGELTVLGKSASSNKKMNRKPEKDLEPLIIGDHVIVGCNSVIYRGVKLETGIFIGDLASIREKVTVGEDSIIGRNAMVETNTKIGKRVTIQTGSYITADMVIEDEVFIGPCCSTSNDKYMGEGNFKHQGPIIRRGAKIGNNATLLPAVTIGENAIVGAGSVITKDVPANNTIVGNPGRIIK
ncbi:N-acetyltransferase [Lederbergia citrea]|uniref:N-acetyltransferase n=1 Tax=Lederbergia citrea TaxID=2833581 RepID=A0A942UQH5_9BACI|nr:N-acetyltransferase [Lederbergia citrea]MBS4179630.1 N-acetyltransferase [Lederbergia citrea]MBS4206298.1 N-acetyltransferase [Lederbergia citrea]MBS4224990.1 N-acetyltransferase [Lederbergia citrea]